MNAGDRGGRAAEKVGAWFLRLPTDITTNPYIQDNASATDWNVLHAIVQHQGYHNRKTFPIPIDRTAEEARCSRRAAIRSISWWVSLGALIKTKKRRMNVYEIPQHFNVPPRIGASPRHNTPRCLKRGDHGRIVPAHGTGKVPAHGTSKVPAHGTPNQKSYSEVFNEKPPYPPKGGNVQPPTPKEEIESPKIQQAKPEEVAAAIACAVSSICSKPRAKRQGLAVGEGAFKKTIEKIIADSQVDE
jgi:hypothetical protein